MVEVGYCEQELLTFTSKFEMTDLFAQLTVTASNMEMLMLKLSNISCEFIMAGLASIF